jgi:hypothetical protein
VKMKSTGNEKLRFTVVLCCMADGTKLPPLVIFKRKTMPKGDFPPGVFVKVQAKGWMDEPVMKYWTGEVWEKERKGGLTKKRSLLVMDSMNAHTTPAVTNKLTNMKTARAIIPGGLTSCCQPLDVSINKPFKGNMRRHWSDWMLGDKHEYTKSGLQKKAPCDLVCKWVK